MARLLLVRHGKTRGEGSRYYGHIDIGLSQEGVKQVEILRGRLAAENLNTVYSSDLKRAFDTAEIIATAHKLKVIPCSDLRELDFGELADMTFEEMKERYHGATKFLSGQHLDMSAPGKRFVAEVQKQPAERTLLVVAHGGSLKVLLCILLGISLKHWWQFRLEPASLTVVETYSKGSVLCLLNDTSHLEQG
ncbi:Phosphoserine phosphatase 1 [subsurface metagenome]